MQALYVGLLLTVLGMGTVFAFLALMVWCVEVSAKVLARFAYLMPEKEAPRRKKEAPKVTASGPDPLVPVVVAAVHRHLSENP
jgi:sodium pump decarboxylase gamma subunit